MSASVTVFGSANTDYVVMVPRIPLPGETVSGGAPRALPGRNRVNQATATARQTQPTAFVGSVGDDAGGATPQLVTTLDGDGCAVMAADGTCTPIRPPKVSPIDTSRAGDTFCGVIAAGLSAGMALVPAAVSAVIDPRDLECEIVHRPPIERTPVHLR